MHEPKLQHKHELYRCLPASQESYSKVKVEYEMVWRLDLVHGRIKIREVMMFSCNNSQSVLEVARPGLRDGPCWKLKVPIVANSCYNLHCPVLHYSSSCNWQQVQSRTRQ